VSPNLKPVGVTVKARTRRVVVASALALAFIPATSATAGMVGFTGEIFYSGWENLVSPENHSYGFSSTNYPGGGYTTVTANIVPDGRSGKANSATNFVRVCWVGVYPNCTDIGLVGITQGIASPAHTIDMHSLY